MGIVDCIYVDSRRWSFLPRLHIPRIYKRILYHASTSTTNVNIIVMYCSQRVILADFFDMDTNSYIKCVENLCEWMLESIQYVDARFIKIRNIYFIQFYINARKILIILIEYLLTFDLSNTFLPLRSCRTQKAVNIFYIERQEMKSLMIILLIFVSLLFWILLI